MLTYYVEGDTRELDDMPFDRDGCHATGFEVYHDGQWWNEYEREDRETFLAR